MLLLKPVNAEFRMCCYTNTDFIYTRFLGQIYETFYLYFELFTYYR